MSALLSLLDTELIPVAQNPIHKGSGFFIRRNPPPIPPHGVLSGIIRCQGKGHIVVKPASKPPSKS